MVCVFKFPYFSISGADLNGHVAIVLCMLQLWYYFSVTSDEIERLHSGTRRLVMRGDWTKIPLLEWITSGFLYQSYSSFKRFIHIYIGAIYKVIITPNTMLAMFKRALVQVIISLTTAYPVAPARRCLQYNQYNVTYIMTL